jgi:type II restriction enzyme
MEHLVDKAIEDFRSSIYAYTKFITPNDTGSTGSHQSGFHISKSAWQLFFDTEGVKGTNKDVFITIKWQDDFETSSRFIYYGAKTRNEYRLTRFGRGFPFLTEDNVGNFLILCKAGPEYYKAYVLTTDEQIENFISSSGISITDTDQLLKSKHPTPAEDSISELITEALKKIENKFPTSQWVSKKAQELFFSTNKSADKYNNLDPDILLLHWIDIEYELFRAIENRYYENDLQKGFKDLQELINLSNSLLNRRKSRAGKALENHLSEIFTQKNIKHETQVITEGNKKPDFIFPNGKAYHDITFNIEDLFVMAAKTTCKDRWRQILNEADRIEYKHLMTLQQGISKNQLKEMTDHKVILVVPNIYKKSFPREYLDKILSLSDFINKVKSHQ